MDEPVAFAAAGWAMTRRSVRWPAWPRRRWYTCGQRGSDWPAGEGDVDSLRQRLYRTEAIVIRRVDVGEADRILTLYTPHRGKVRAVAKGVRRPESHLGGNLELFVRVNLLLAHGRNLDIITQAESVAAFRELRANLESVQAVFYIGELLDGLTEEGLPSEPVYVLLLETLTALDQGHPVPVVLRYYEYRLLSLMGYRLEVSQCVVCRRPLEPVISGISLEAGGVLCPTCQPADPAARPLSVNALKVLRLMAREPLSTLLRYRLSPPLLSELERLGHASVVLRLEREPRSWALATPEPS